MQLVDTHVYSNYTYDEYLSLSKLDGICSRQTITTVAITDYNKIEGAMEVARLTLNDLILK